MSIDTQATIIYLAIFVALLYGVWWFYPTTTSATLLLVACGWAKTADTIGPFFERLLEKIQKKTDNQ